MSSANRPTAGAAFEGRRVDVMSRGEPIEPGSRVRVIEVEGNRVVVAGTADGDAHGGRNA